MNKTKIKIFSITLVLIALVLIAVPVAFSITRNISSYHDDFDTFIRNSKGNYWEVSQANFQAAIDDLGSGGGTVWVGSDFTTSNTTIVKKNVIVDLEGHTITYTGSGNCIQLKNSSRIENGRLDLQNATLDDNDAAIFVDGSDRVGIISGSNWNEESIQLTGASHMVLISGGTAGEQSGTGVLLEADGSTGYEYIVFTKWDNISTFAFKYGYHLSCPGGSTSNNNYVNGNHFVNCLDEASQIGIYLTRNQSLDHIQSGVEGNKFSNIAIEAYNGAWGIHSNYALWNEGDMNFFDIMTWDFQGIEKYYFSDSTWNVGHLEGSINDITSVNSYRSAFTLQSGGYYYNGQQR